MLRQVSTGKDAPPTFLHVSPLQLSSISAIEIGTEQAWAELHLYTLCMPRVVDACVCACKLYDVLSCCSSSHKLRWLLLSCCASAVWGACGIECHAHVRIYDVVELSVCVCGLPAVYCGLVSRR